MKEHAPEREQVGLALAVHLTQRGYITLSPDCYIIKDPKGWARGQAAEYGAGDRLGLYDHKGKHSFPKNGRKIAYQWLDYWLKHKPTRDEVGP